MRNFGTRLACAVLFASVLSAGGCGGSTASTGKTGSETNWLRACSADADCGGQACLCGVCSTACSEDFDCSGLQSASCAPAAGDAQTALCGASTLPSPGVCLPSCDVTRLCAPDALCIGGTCVASPTVQARVAAVGDPCVPAEEFRQDFPGFAATEVNIEAGSPGCGGGVCVADHFQGRTTCPYGQTSTALSLAAADPARCRVPDGDGNVTSTPVSVEVSPELASRRAADTVTCSCQCAGPDPYLAGQPATGLCTCPSGTECKMLLAPINGTEGASFCIKTGTDYDPLNPPTQTCDGAGTDPATDCGNGRMNP